MTTKADVLKAIRANCVECSGGSVLEPARCTCYKCPLHPFRLGVDPNPIKSRGVAARAAAGRARDRKAHQLPRQG